MKVKEIDLIFGEVAEVALQYPDPAKPAGIDVPVWMREAIEPSLSPPSLDLAVKGHRYPF